MTPTPSLFDFGKEILQRQIDYVALGKMHEVLAHYMERAIRREILRLHISTPPQHAKSTWVTLGSVWGYGLDPYLKIIRGSHRAELSMRDSKITQRLTQDAVFQKYFGTYPLARGQESASRWGFNWPGSDGRANFIAVSTGSPGTGESGSMVIADDLLSGAEAADSQDIRDAAWNCLSSGLLTRIPKDGVLISIATRWSEDDPAGRLIALYERNPQMAPPLTVVNIQWNGNYSEDVYEAN